MGELKARAKNNRTMAENRPIMYSYILSESNRESLDGFKHY